jgi:hypothetical protein
VIEYLPSKHEALSSVYPVPGTVVHVYNLSYLGGRDRRITVQGAGTGEVVQEVECLPTGLEFKPKSYSPHLKVILVARWGKGGILNDKEEGESR